MQRQYLMCIIKNYIVGDLPKVEDYHFWEGPEEHCA